MAGPLAKVIFGRLLSAGLGMGAQHLENSIRGSVAEDERAQEDAEAKRQLEIIKAAQSSGLTTTETGQKQTMEIFNKLLRSPSQEMREQTDQFIDPRVQAAAAETTTDAQDNIIPYIPEGLSITDPARAHEEKGFPEPRKSFFEANKDILVPINGQEVPLKSLPAGVQAKYLADQTIDPEEQSTIDLRKQQTATSKASEERTKVLTAGSRAENKRKADEAERESKLSSINSFFDGMKTQIATALSERSKINTKDRKALDASNAELDVLKQQLAQVSTYRIEEKDYPLLAESVMRQFRLLYATKEEADAAFQQTPIGQWAAEQVRLKREAANKIKTPPVTRKQPPKRFNRGANFRGR